MKFGLVAGGAALLPFRHNGREALEVARAFADSDPETRFRFRPFQVPLPIPPVLKPVRPFTPGAVFHGVAPEFDPAHPDHDPDWDHSTLKHYKIFIEQRDDAEIIPGIFTPVFTYRDANSHPGTGSGPGPTILARFNEPIVVRQHNRLRAPNTYVEHDVEISTHLHGAHSPAHADGFPNFYILPGQARDYYYPNIVPKRVINRVLQFDRSATPSTMWYHDHGMDLTGFNVSRGLFAFYLLIDDLEQQLIDDNVLPDVWTLKTDPDGSFDIPIAIVDQQFNGDGTLRYDFLDHNGRIGDVFTVNGVAHPFFHVQRRKYRFRILNGSNARIYQLRLSSRRPFLQIGTDSWLLPSAIPVPSVRVAMAERVDVIIDFAEYAPGDVVFLENIMFQPDGRGPKEVDPKKERTRLIKFEVQRGSVRRDIMVDDGTPLRPHDPIRREDIVRTRIFEFERGNGAWQINGQFFSPRRADAIPERDLDGVQAERWILKNNSGGWWHPIHIHLEHHEIKRLNGRRPPLARRFKSDVSTLTGNGVAEVFMRFRTFTGPFVFHCHNLEHEDMRMMAAFDPRPRGQDSPLNGVDKVDPAVSGVPVRCERLEPRLFFDAVGDVEHLEGRGVGFPCDDFELD